MTALVVTLALILLAIAFAAGVYVGYKVTASELPTPVSTGLAALDTEKAADSAAKAAQDEAAKKAEEDLHASDDDVRARVAKLRALGQTAEGGPVE